MRAEQPRRIDTCVSSQTPPSSKDRCSGERHGGTGAPFDNAKRAACGRVLTAVGGQTRVADAAGRPSLRLRVAHGSVKLALCWGISSPALDDDRLSGTCRRAARRKAASLVVRCGLGGSGQWHQARGARVGCAQAGRPKRRAGLHQPAKLQLAASADPSKEELDDPEKRRGIEAHRLAFWRHLCKFG